MNVTVLLNQGRDHWAGWKSGHPLTVATRLQLDLPDHIDPYEALEIVWAITNSYPPTPGFPEGELHGPAANFPEEVAAYRRGGNRSVSVGDVVLLDGQPWAVASFGWDRLGREQVGADAIEINEADKEQP